MMLEKFVHSYVVLKYVYILQEDLSLLKTENSLLKRPSVISSKLSSSVPSLTNSTLPEPLLVEVKPIQG